MKLSAPASCLCLTFCLAPIGLTAACDGNANNATKGQGDSGNSLCEDVFTKVASCITDAADKSKVEADRASSVAACIAQRSEHSAACNSAKDDLGKCTVGLTCEQLRSTDACAAQVEKSATACSTGTPPTASGDGAAKTAVLPQKRPGERLLRAFAQ